MATHGLANDFESADPPGERGEQKFGFKPRDHHPDADVNSAAKRDVARRLASQVKTIGVLPLTRVSIGGAQEEQHLLIATDMAAFDLAVA